MINIACFHISYFSIKPPPYNRFFNIVTILSCICLVFFKRIVFPERLCTLGRRNLQWPGGAAAVGGGGGGGPPPPPPPLLFPWRGPPPWGAGGGGGVGGPGAPPPPPAKPKAPGPGPGAFRARSALPPPPRKAGGMPPQKRAKGRQICRIRGEPRPRAAWNRAGFLLIYNLRLKKSRFYGILT